MSQDYRTPSTPREVSHGGGPRTPEGKAVSSQNARKHGCCSDAVLIVNGETMEEYRALEATWLGSYKPGDEAETELVHKLIDAEWFLARATRTLAEVEAQIHNSGLSPLEWTDVQHLALTRFTRYQTTRANAAAKCRKAVEDYRRSRANERVKAERHEVHKEKSKPEPSVAECIQQMMDRKAERDRIAATLIQSRK